jgi:hypothetical protein
MTPLWADGDLRAEARWLFCPLSSGLRSLTRGRRRSNDHKTQRRIDAPPDLAAKLPIVHRAPVHHLEHEGKGQNNTRKIRKCCTFAQSKPGRNGVWDSVHVEHSLMNHRQCNGVTIALRAISMVSRTGRVNGMASHLLSSGSGSAPHSKFSRKATDIAIWCSIVRHGTGRIVSEGACQSSTSNSDLAPSRSPRPVCALN